MNEESFVNWNDGAQTRPIYSVFTTKNFFKAIGVPVERGRGIRPDDPDNVVVLNHGFWSASFHSDPAILGRTINLDGKDYTVIGILPASNRGLTGFGYTPDVYMPRYLSDTLLAIYARLRPGMSRGEALAGLRTVAARLDAQRRAGAFKLSEDVRVSPIAGFARLRGDSEAMAIGLFFAMLLVVVGLVLLVACVNVAGVLLARASSRRRELAIRLALGAGRGRLVQQLLAEGLLLSIAGTACGLGLAHGIAALIDRLRLPLPIPIHLHIEADWRLALYTAFLLLVATLACGLLPAWRTANESIAPKLARERRMRLHRTLVTAQIAISVVVLAMGCLFVRNLSLSAAINPGFDVHHTVRAEVHLPPERYSDGAKILRYADQALAELRSLPGVQAAGAARIVPFTDQTRMGGRITFADNGEQRPVLFQWNAITPGFLAAMGIPIRQGRDFTKGDQGQTRVAIVNREFVRRYFGGRSAIGTISGEPGWRATRTRWREWWKIPRTSRSGKRTSQRCTSR
jgi:predicted permease